MKNTHISTILKNYFVIGLSLLLPLKKGETETNLRCFSKLYTNNSKHPYNNPSKYIITFSISKNFPLDVGISLSLYGHARGGTGTSQLRKFNSLPFPVFRIYASSHSLSAVTAVAWYHAMHNRADYVPVARAIAPVIAQFYLNNFHESMAHCRCWNAAADCGNVIPCRLSVYSSKTRLCNPCAFKHAHVCAFVWRPAVVCGTCITSSRTTFTLLMLVIDRP